MRTLGVALSLLKRTRRQVYVLALPDLDAFPERVPIDSPYFVLLLAADFQARYCDRDRLSRRILGSGCVYFCAWGNACEHMHDWFDEALVEQELCSQSLGQIMTTWHSADSLEEAVEFAVVSAEPDDQYAAGCRSVVLATVGNSEWSAQMEQAASRHVI